MLRTMAAGLLSLLLALGGAGAAFAAANPSGHGQPNQTCLSSSAPNEPGHASGSPGSAFNETGPGTGGAAYSKAGAPSQYDVACYQVSQPH
ncbi:hypothetical protein ABT095_08260 [Kitasatospora sp. NPDC002227]|uniref:hypothetical protein n=1 Tax=Kitasatospora sp. NPDC002227 TaxID=3154773 RepID=UPI00331FB488